MKLRQLSLEKEPATQAHRQLSLAIGAPVSGVPHKPAARQRLSDRNLQRTIALDEILWMRDVVQLTGKHRCTIHRWMHQRDVSCQRMHRRAVLRGGCAPRSSNG